MNTFVYTDSSAIQVDLEAAPKPILTELAGGYPFTSLTDRQFECLVGDIITKHSGKAGTVYAEVGQVLLMQGVAERGRDCALLSTAGVHIGVVQCKRYDQLITMPGAAREVIKFCLHALLDDRLMPEPDGFLYVFAAARDFNDRAKLLLNGLSDAVMDTERLLGWIREVAADYEFFKSLDAEDALPAVSSMFTKMKVVTLGFNELTNLMIDQSEIAARYFSVRKVVDNAHVEKLVVDFEQFKDALSNPDVRVLFDELSSFPEDRRFDMGMFSLWGYPERFIRKIATAADFKARIFSISQGKQDLDLHFNEYILERIDEEIFATLTARRMFSPIAITGARPYIAGQLMGKWMEAVGSRLFTSSFTPSVPTDAIGVRTYILARGRDYLNQDWSAYVGDGELLELKKRLAKHTYGEYKTVDQMGEAYDADWSKMLPYLSEIVRRINEEIPSGTTIVLSGNRWIDDPTRVGKIMKRMSALSTKPPKSRGPSEG